MRRLQKYLYDFTSPEEEEKLLGNPEVNNALFDAWNDFGDVKSSDNTPDTNELLNSIYRKANIPSPPAKSKKLITSFSIAAGIAILIALGVYVFNYFYNPEVEVCAAKGHKKELTLPDGSRVWLNADTKISYRKKFNDPVREVKLSGEAYFSVVKNPHRPFIVKTSRLDIKVLGTVFNVKSYPEEHTCEATLVSGSITIERAEKSGLKKTIRLQPKQKATYSLSEDKIKVENAISEKITCWKSGKLVFDNETINTVLKKLERWYGLKVDLETQIQDTAAINERYTIMVKDDNIEEVIRLLQLTAPLTFRVSNPDGTSTKIYTPLH